ncbi:MAG: hypothetical protein V1897_19850 [Pseudomonadota bacterium]
MSQEQIGIDYIAAGGRPMNTSELLSKLANKFRPPEYAFLSDVRNCTGYGRQIRTADAMAMCLYPSRGLHLTGFELKVSRSDWMHEKEQPDKAEAIAQYCDFWYLVISEGSILQPGELPPAWGLMVANGRGGAIKIVKAAPELKPKSIDRLMLAGILRNISQSYVARAEISDEVERAREGGKKSREWEISHEKNQASALREAISDFEKASGIKIDSWAGERIGKAVEFVLTGGHKRVKRDLLELQGTVNEIKQDIDEAIRTCGIDLTEELDV